MRPLLSTDATTVTTIGGPPETADVTPKKGPAKTQDGFRRVQNPRVAFGRGLGAIRQRLGAFVGRAKKPVGAALIGTLILGGCTGGPMHTNSPSQRVLGGVPVTVAPVNQSASEKLQFYRRLVQAAGNTWRPGDMHVIAVRGYDLRSRSIHSTQTASNFRDTLVVAGMRNGEPYVQEFAGSTYPGQRTTEGLGQDLNWDGVLDVAMIAEGAYRAVPRVEGDFNGFPAFRLRNGNSTVIPTYRDTNQDGIYSAEEQAYAVQRRATAGRIMLHAGGVRKDGSGFVASIGCPNAEDMAALIDAVGGPNARYGITLLNAFEEEPYAVYTLPLYE